MNSEGTLDVNDLKVKLFRRLLVFGLSGATVLICGLLWALLTMWRLPPEVPASALDGRGGALMGTTLFIMALAGVGIIGAGLYSLIPLLIQYNEQKGDMFP